LGAQEQGRVGLHQAYGIDRLVWFEVHDVAETALRREKQIKEWKRDWEINLIEHENRHWIDLFPSLTI
jgi:putative endonuclease